MANPDGSFIWYELSTPDPDAATAFYGAVVGWTIGGAPAGPIDYRMIGAPDGAVGGVMRLDAAMQAGGARPVWLGYLGVADVDAKMAAVKQAGGGVIVPPTDIPDVGRFALLTDPAGAPFYVICGDSPEPSNSFARTGSLGRCAWNELATPDQSAALAFYGSLFGMEKTGAMSMGPMGDYSFLSHAGQEIGAMADARQGGMPPGWTFYFRVRDVDAAAQAIADGGGTVFMGPHTVPTGERIVIATDPQGATFGLVDAGDGRPAAVEPGTRPA